MAFKPALLCCAIERVNVSLFLLSRNLEQHKDESLSQVSKTKSLLPQPDCTYCELSLAPFLPCPVWILASASFTLTSVAESIYQ